MTAVDCPLPLDTYPRITLAHGGGGRLAQRLTEELFLPAFGGPRLAARHDGACLPATNRALAFSTDAHVVRPLFFPGGDIGRLAVFGTANDLAMCGARARHLAVSFILEEGLPTATLWRVACSMGAAARECGIEIVAGDTKVVERGKGDGVYVSSAGVGEILAPMTISPAAIRAGDRVLLSGDLGRHGIAVLAAREEFALELPLESDLAPLWPAVAALLSAGIAPHCMRDLTRGGLAAAMCEIAAAAGRDIELDETALPVVPAVRGACELLGLDPTLVANEGRCIVIVPAAASAAALAALRAVPVAADSVEIGVVGEEAGGRVWLRTPYGQQRRLAMPSGAQLPRIC